MKYNDLNYVDSKEKKLKIAETPPNKKCNCPLENATNDKTCFAADLLAILSDS